MDALLEGFGIVLGVTAGVIAGTAVTLGVQLWLRRQDERQKVDNLKFELEFDVNKLDGWLEFMTEFRNAVSVSAPDSFVRHFDLSRALFVTANAMYATGQLFKFVSQDDMAKLQQMAGEFSWSGEQIMNAQIQQERTGFNQQRAAQTANFWEMKFKEHRQSLQGIIAGLP